MATKVEKDAELMDIVEKLNTLSDRILSANNDADVKAALIKRYEELMQQRLKLESQLGEINESGYEVKRL
jgi:gamma-glutamyl phosphate reductase